MRRFLSTVTLAAFIAASLTILPPARAQEVSAETSQRLREAIDNLNVNKTDDSIGVPAQASLTKDDLDTLVAPYALYPDSLLAQVLVAATHPLQIAEANQLIFMSDELSDEKLAETLEAKDWDPSILVLLSGFPSVITKMADALDATERLGSAMVAQDDDVLAAVQRMRAEAAAAGNLASNEAQIVMRAQDRISIRPARPDVVYVPRYDPETVYVSTRSAPIVQQPQSNFNGQSMLVVGAIAFGSALLVEELFGDDKQKDSGWDDYWHRDNVIDWHDRQFYPRPDRDTRHWAWSNERNRDWDRSHHDWRRDADSRRRNEVDRRSVLRWADPRETHAGQKEHPAAISWRDKAHLEKARHDTARENDAGSARQRRDKDTTRRAAAQKELASGKEKSERHKDVVAPERDEPGRKDRGHAAEPARDSSKNHAGDHGAKNEKPSRARPEAHTDTAEKLQLKKVEQKPESAKRSHVIKKTEPEKRTKSKPDAAQDKKPVPVKNTDSTKKLAPIPVVTPRGKPPEQPVQKSEKAKHSSDKSNHAKHASACRDGSKDKNCKPTD